MKEASNQGNGASAGRVTKIDHGMDQDDWNNDEFRMTMETSIHSRDAHGNPWLPRKPCNNKYKWFLVSREPLYNLNSFASKGLDRLVSAGISSQPQRLGSQKGVHQAGWFTEPAKYKFGGFEIVSILQEIFPSPCGERSKYAKD